MMIEKEDDMGRGEKTMKITSPDQLQHHHRFVDYLYWNLFFLIHVIAAFVAIVRHSPGWAVTYVIVGIGLATLIYRFQCTHCPHYTANAKGTRCMFLWGVPKIFRPRPGPLNFFEKIVPFIAGAVWVLFPLYWLLLEPTLFILYWLSIIVLFLTIYRYECRRCTYFHCSLNRAPQDLQPQDQSE
jgi:hypothetical protein